MNHRRHSSEKSSAVRYQNPKSSAAGVVGALRKWMTFNSKYETGADHPKRPAKPPKVWNWGWSPSQYYFSLGSSSPIRLSSHLSSGYPSSSLRATRIPPFKALWNRPPLPNLKVQLFKYCWWFFRRLSSHLSISISSGYTSLRSALRPTATVVNGSTAIYSYHQQYL